MWNYDARSSADGRTQQVALSVHGRAMSFAEALASLQSEARFRDYLTGLLASAPFLAFRWETPPVSESTLTRPFEFVTIDDPRLERAPDPAAFAEYFTAADAPDVVATNNASSTAMLVVPRAIAPLVSYTHLARFVRSAPAAQIHSFWTCVAVTASRRLSARRQWISTAGAGVAWLHVRLDDAPKYYAYRPYAISD